MTTKYVRIKCQPDDEADKDNYDFAFDAVVEGDHLRSLPWYGVVTRGKLELHPFRLETDGHIDFGTGYGEADRYWTTTLFNHSIRVGEVFSVEGTHARGVEIMYAIVELNQIG